MASLWQKKKGGVWCVTYRENGRQRVRSLRTKNKREAIKVQREIESILEEQGTVALQVLDRPLPEQKNPLLEEFWGHFFSGPLRIVHHAPLKSTEIGSLNRKNLRERIVWET